MISFADRLKFLRKEQKLTQQNLAEILNIKRATIAKWESKNAIPDTETLDKISVYFDTSIDYLIGKSNVRQIDNNSIIDKEPTFFLTIQNFLHFIEVAYSEELPPELIKKLIQGLQLTKFEEKFLFDSLGELEFLNTNLASKETNEQIKKLDGFGNKTETNDTK
jgi:bacteriophage CI repressor helix-turn-helix domain